MKIFKRFRSARSGQYVTLDQALANPSETVAEAVHVSGHAAFVSSIRGCARCHGEGHADVLWRGLAHPIEDSDGTLWTHWAPCPTNGDPILMLRR